MVKRPTFDTLTDAELIQLAKILAPAVRGPDLWWARFFAAEAETERLRQQMVAVPRTAPASVRLAVWWAWYRCRHRRDQIKKTMDILFEEARLLWEP